MVIADPLLLVMSMLISLGFGFVIGLSETTGPQAGFDGATGVGVKVKVGADVLDGVKVNVGAGVFVGGLGVFDGGFVAVGVGGIVLVGVRLGNTTGV